jgi:hypothetical protein
MGEIIKTGLLLGILAITIPTMATAPVASLGDMASSGNLLVEAVRDAGKRDKVLEIVAIGCMVTFKTRIDTGSFRARVTDLGSGSAIEREGYRIRLRGSPGFSDTLIVHSGDQTRQLLDALQSVFPVSANGTDLRL